MTKRPEDLSGDELRVLTDDLDNHIDLLSDDDESAAELIAQQPKAGRSYNDQSEPLKPCPFQVMRVRA